jgi:hypothetical protein
MGACANKDIKMDHKAPHWAYFCLMANQFFKVLDSGRRTISVSSLYSIILTPYSGPLVQLTHRALAPILPSSESEFLSIREAPGDNLGCQVQSANATFSVQSLYLILEEYPAVRRYQCAELVETPTDEQTHVRTRQ